MRGVCQIGGCGSDCMLLGLQDACSLGVWCAGVCEGKGGGGGQ